MKESQDRATKPLLVLGQVPRGHCFSGRTPGGLGPLSQHPLNSWACRLEEGPAGCAGWRKAQLGMQAGGRPNWAVITLALLTEGLSWERCRTRRGECDHPHFSDVEAAVQEVIPRSFQQ